MIIACCAYLSYDNAQGHRGLCFDLSPLFCWKSKLHKLITVCVFLSEGVQTEAVLCGVASVCTGAGVKVFSCYSAFLSAPALGCPCVHF